MKQKKNIFSPGRQKPAEATEVWKAYERGMEYLTRCGQMCIRDRRTVVQTTVLFYIRYKNYGREEFL